MPKGKKSCPECQEQYGARTLKCTCGYEFRKGVFKPKLLRKKDIEPANTMVFTGDVEDSFTEPVEKVTKKVKCEGEKITLKELARACIPFESSRDNGTLTLNRSVFIRGHLSSPLYNKKLILPFNAVYAKIIADSGDGTMSIWNIDDRGDPDIIYMGAVAKV